MPLPQVAISGFTLYLVNEPGKAVFVAGDHFVNDIQRTMPMSKIYCLGEITLGQTEILFPAQRSRRRSGPDTYRTVPEGIDVIGFIGDGKCRGFFGNSPVAGSLADEPIVVRIERMVAGKSDKLSAGMSAGQLCRRGGNGRTVFCEFDHIVTGNIRKETFSHLLSI